MEPLISVLLGKCFFMTVGYYIKFTAHDGFHSILFSFCNKLEGAKHVSMIGNGHGFHAIGLCFFKQTTDVCCSIEQGKLSVYVKV